MARSSESDWPCSQLSLRYDTLDATHDTARYPQWNPFVRSLDGPLVVGRHVTVGLQLPDRKLQSLRPTLVEVDAGRAFTWLGHIGFVGMFDARHRFHVEHLGEGRSRRWSSR